MQTETLEISVLWPDYYEDCDFCTDRLREAIEALDGADNVVIDAPRRKVQLTYDKEKLTFEEIYERARSVGVQVTERFSHERLTVSGLDCPDCASKLETAIRRIRGVVWASLNYGTAILVVEYDPRRVDTSAICRTVRRFGYDVLEREPSAEQDRRLRSRWSLRVTTTAVSGVMLAIGGLMTAAGAQQAAEAVFIAAAVVAGAFAARTGILSLIGRTLDTNFLVTTAAVGAIILGDAWEAAAVTFLFSLGGTLEAITIDRTRRSIRSLIGAFPTSATVRRGSSLEEVLIDDIAVGEVVLIKPGDRVPVDGTIVDGSSTVNEAPITGESVPRDRTRGDRVYAGSINGRGALEVRATSAAEDNTLSRVVHLVEEAQAQKAPSQRFSETFGRYYTPAVVGLAVVVALLWPALIGGTYADSIRRALVLLVVSCPCALVISTPVAIVAAIGNAARHGVLIKGGAHLEAMGEVGVVAFDKTGTLTTGRLSLCGIAPRDGLTPDQLLALAAAVESRSEHPLADAIVAGARDRDLPQAPVSFFEAYPGKGALAVVDGEAVRIGSARFLRDNGIDVDPDSGARELLDRGCTLIYVAREDAVVGAIGASDAPRATAARAIADLRRAGIRRTVMLTGDTAQTGAAVARQVGIDEAFTELLPEHKLDKIKELAHGGQRTAMVGDGINDAPALAAADVGIAMGGAGSPAAIEAADVALMADDIVMLPYAIDLSRRARRVIRQNIYFSLAVVVVLVVGALAEWVNLATGIFGHEGSALLVIANSARLLSAGRKPVGPAMDPAYGVSAN